MLSLIKFLTILLIYRRELKFTLTRCGVLWNYPLISEVILIFIFSLNWFEKSILVLMNLMARLFLRLDSTFEELNIHVPENFNETQKNKTDILLNESLL